MGLHEKPKKLIPVKADVNCIRCGKKTYKKIILPDGYFYWRCSTCLYETQISKKK